MWSASILSFIQREVDVSRRMEGKERYRERDKIGKWRGREGEEKVRRERREEDGGKPHFPVLENLS